MHRNNEWGLLKTKINLSLKSYVPGQSTELWIDLSAAKEIGCGDESYSSWVVKRWYLSRIWKMIRGRSVWWMEWRNKWVRRKLARTSTSAQDIKTLVLVRQWVLPTMRKVAIVLSVPETMQELCGSPLKTTLGASFMERRKTDSQEGKVTCPIPYS